MRRIRGHLSYANVMVTVLAFIVLGGTAFAVAKLDKNSVGSKQLKAGAVHTADIGDGAVTADKLAQGAAGGDTTVRSADATIPLTCTETTFSPTNATLFCNGQGSVTATCESGEHATGGGFTPTVSPATAPPAGTPTSSSSAQESRPDPANGTPTAWFVSATGFGTNSGSPGLAHPQDPKITAYVVCAS
jgi:hypothetical protein